MSLPFELSPTAIMVLQTTIGVSLLILLVLLIRRPFAKAFGAKAAYLLWVAPAARLAAAPMVSNWSIFGLFSSSQSTTPEAPVLRSETAFLVPSPPPAEWTPAELPVRLVTEFEMASSVAETPSWFETLDWGLIGVTALIAGTVLALGLAIWRQARFAWLVNLESEPASQDVQDMARDIAASIGLKRRPRIQTGLLCSGPLVTGVFRPTVLLPAWFELDYTKEEQAHAILHELMHVKRGDLFSLQFASLFLAAQWFNPLAHMAVRAFRSDQEAACDADVLAREGTNAHGYGQTLVKTVRISVGAPPPAAAGLPLAHAIKERLILMQNPKPTLKKRLAGASLAALIGTAGLALTATAAPQDRDQDKDVKVEKELKGAEKERKRYSYTYSSGMDGKRFIILSNPMEDATKRFETELAPRLKELELRMEAMPPMPPMPPMPVQSLSLQFDAESEFAALPDIIEGLDLSGLANLQVQTLDNGTVKIIADGELIELDMSEFEANMENFEIRMEAWGEEFEARMEGFEVEMEAWEEEYEAKVEAWEQEFEARMEDWETDFEATFEDGFDERLESSAELLEEMVEGCDDMEGDELAIIQVEDDETGETFNAVCISEAYEDRPNRVRAFVMSSDELSEEEKQRFLDQHDDD